MSDSKKIEAYIKKHEKWSDALTQLREILLKTEAVETVKWGIPTYTVNGKNVMGIGAFKNHFGLWFFNGVFLKDTQGVLRNANSETTRGMRQLNFKSHDQIDAQLVFDYALEAIENQKLGKEIKPTPASKKKLIIPVELSNLLNENSVLKTAFYALTPGKQREYADHISGAKREATRLNRLDKCIPLILAGGGLYDKYKNC